MGVTSHCPEHYSGQIVRECQYSGHKASCLEQGAQPCFLAASGGGGAVELCAYIFQWVSRDDADV